MTPLVGVRIPARHDSKVVLPHPLGPSSSTSSPSRASTSSCSMGRTTYPPCEYSIVRSRIVTPDMSARERQRGVNSNGPPKTNDAGEQSNADADNRQGEIRPSSDVERNRERGL